jgi:hypothetical protein
VLGGKFDKCARYGQAAVGYRMEDLEEGITFHREVLRVSQSQSSLMLHPPGHPQYSAPLNNLAAQAAVNARYSQSSRMEDLEGGGDLIP